MVKKIQKATSDKPAAAAGLLDNQVAQSVRDSAQQIWLAGMGAFAKAQEGRAKVFEALIKEGTNLQRKTQAVAEEKIGEVAGRMSAMAGDVGAKAGQHWDKLESIFEQRTAKAMQKLGVPTAQDISALSQRIDALAAAVSKLGAAPKAAPAKKAPAAKRAAKTAANKAPAKKAASKKAAAKKSAH